MISLQDGRKELFQWDTNRYVTLSDQITDTTEIHFANGVFAHSIDVKIENNKALIPDILLQYAKPLKVWLFVGETNNGYTKVEHTFQVKERNKPSDYVYTPTEQISLQELIDKFEDFKDSIGNEVEDYLKENPVTFEETDPTVPQWAKEKNKPSYTADEVGALSKDTKILTTEEVADEIEQYMQEHPMLVEETDPTVPEWAKQPEKPTYTAEEVGAQPKGDYALKSEIPSIPVQSVNGKTGKVELTAEDVGALSDDVNVVTPEEVEAEVNKALEEAKESGEFKGDTGDSGVYIGAEEPTDPNVRVWIDPDGEVHEPVYELIETIILNEDMVIERTQEPNGKPYAFTALKIFIDSTAAKFEGTNVWINFNNGWSSPLWLGGFSTNPNFDVRRSCGEFIKQNGDWYGKSLANAMKGVVASPSETMYEYDKNYNHIVGMWMSAAIPANSKVIIKGVRA